MLSCRTDGISEALSPRDYLLYFFGFMRAVRERERAEGGLQVSRVRKGEGSFGSFTVRIQEVSTQVFQGLQG